MENEQGYTGNPFEDIGCGLCKKCGHRTIDRSENPDSVLCSNCREELIRLKIPPVFYIVGAAVFLLVAFTFIASIGGLRNFGTYNKSGAIAEEGYVVTALSSLNQGGTA